MKENVKLKIAIILTLLGVVSIIIGTTYAIYENTINSNKSQIIKTGVVNFTLTETTNGLILNNLQELSDYEGMAQETYYEFSITNTGDTKTDYEIYLIDKNSTSYTGTILDDKYVKVGLTINDSKEKIVNLEEVNRLIDKVTLNVGKTANYKLRVWLNFDGLTDTEKEALVGQKIFLTLKINGIQNIESGKLLSYTILGNNNSNVLTTGDTGLFSSTLTDSNNPTYYYKGNVTNNYVSFANNLWRIVRINEDGSIRLIMEEGIDNNYYEVFNIDFSDYTKGYYSNSVLKSKIETWFDNTFTDLEKSKIVKTIFCEAYHVSPSTSFTMGSATIVSYESYSPNFYCTNDSNGYGIVDSGNTYVGLISLDEVLYAGGIIESTNSYYLINGESFWTISPTGLYSNYANPWYIYKDGSMKVSDYGSTWFTNNGGTFGDYAISLSNSIRPVISLNVNTSVEGTGTIDDPYVVKN